MNKHEIKERRDAIAQAWRRTDDKDPNTSDVDQAQAKARAEATQRDWDKRAKPTPNRDRLAQPRALEAWERPSDVNVQRGDSRDHGDSSDIPAHILAQCPSGRRPVRRSDGGYTFELISGTRADSKRVTRNG
jgi:hypothetical protein